MSHMAPNVDPYLWGFQLIDLSAYVIALTIVVYGPALALAVTLGSSLALLVHVGFVVGFLAFGYATYLQWPSRPWKIQVTDSGTLEVKDGRSNAVVGERNETAFQRAVQQLPPLRYLERPASDRLSPGIKLFVASLVILTVSYLVESMIL